MKLSWEPHEAPSVTANRLSVKSDCFWSTAWVNVSVILVLFLLDELLYLRVVLSSVFVGVWDGEKVLLSAYVCRHKLLSVSVSQHPFSTLQCLAFWHTQVTQTAIITLSSMCMCVWVCVCLLLSYIICGIIIHFTDCVNNQWLLNFWQITPTISSIMWWRHPTCCYFKYVLCVTRPFQLP